MAELAIDILSWILLLTGGAFGVIGGLGLVRFPDFYTRLHAAGVADTLCALLIVGGLILQAGFSILTLKLALILLFLLFTAPTASHALARAALVDGVEPKVDAETRRTPSSKP
ncbi:monovalent cation/H(+) antiporter subunit G [Wenzhouxiangella marina]|uniref:Monovalent cation/proton antiporter subunit MnhG/PhaG n=1 Tax=Wenzhouxiangella marina TaxID=1579979 RepID=A0A0K0XT18_9GAMM|nr:monovalent cation/H(+) antiporter subunit G [Wenzhouxiangella marina]AKS40767.1 Monovalent cation/proton antiporter subunit MnhG/PhaG [Wenzhouxiangella marina]MBB6087640.1 multicomponent Na+:H+ antiporter subunit G [Wenzhouxiangella marina]